MEPDERDVMEITPEMPPVDIPTSEPPTANVVPMKPKRKQADKGKKVIPNRAPEECYQTDPRKMTDKEKNDVILFFQANVQGVYDQFESYKRNTEGAFEQARQLREANERLKMESKAKINLIKQNVNMLYQNCMLVNMED